ncbi:MAG TPA: arylamine N-acetyltransferase [Thermoanaerobaculia bacterium]|nr:arylamine N-acetyltransferase [Thermoanaerobaculia bacterium]
MIAADEILEALDLSRAEPGTGFLEALFSRFNAKVLFENASKIVRHAEVADPAAKPRTPEVFWKDHLELGAGGTCFARVAAFDALLAALGYRTRRALGRVRNPNDHAAIFVEAPGGETIADVGFPLPALLPAASAFVETPTVALRVEPFPEGFEITLEGGVPEAIRSFAIHTAPVSAEAYDRLWRETFRPGGPFVQEVSLRRDLGHRILSFARGEVRVDDLCSRLRVPLLGSRPAALAALFDLDERLIARALEIAGDPPPANGHTTLTAFLETGASASSAYDAIGSPEGYRRLLEGVGRVEDLRETPGGFRLTLSAAPGEAAALEEEVSLDPATRRVSIVRRSAAGEQRSSYCAAERGGKATLLREAEFAGAREDLLRQDSLRGRLAASLAVDLLAWSRLRS